MIPFEKRLVERLTDKPFALIGINSDGDRSVLKKIMKAQGITWRSAVDRSTSGPLASRWNVSAWPTLYVLDAKGVIRYKDVPESEIEKMVEELLKEEAGG